MSREARSRYQTRPEQARSSLERGPPATRFLKDERVLYPERAMKMRRHEPLGTVRQLQAPGLAGVDVPPEEGRADALKGFRRLYLENCHGGGMEDRLVQGQSQV